MGYINSHQGGILDNPHLPRLEWEGLRDNITIDTIIEPESLSDSVEKLEISRNEDYYIKARLIGRYNQRIIDPLPNVKPGEIIKPFSIKASGVHGYDKYEIENCYLRGIDNNLHLNSSGDYVANSSARLRIHQFKRFSNTGAKPWSHTEWYLNSADGNSYCSQVSKRSYESQYFRHRHIDPEDGIKYIGRKIESDGVDYAIVRLEGYAFILQDVPKEFGPEWCKKLGIEYREDLGRIPKEEERKAISEIVSFMFGHQLLNVGYTIHDTMGYPIEEFMVNPWGDAKAISQRAGYQPIRLISFDDPNNTERYLSNLISKYIEFRKQLDLSDALWRYWISNQLPLGTNLPILASGLEIIASAWFRNNKSPSRGAYIDDAEWVNLIKDEIKSIEKKLGERLYRNRITNKIKNAFRMGFNERFDIFFDEIGLTIGQSEREALKSRNRMTHATFGASDAEIVEMIKMSSTYRTLFHRVLLKLLGYDGRYIDYSTAGWPDIGLTNPPG
jgi:hypothetical protein